MNRTERRKNAKSEKARVDETIASGLELMRQGNFDGAQRAFRNVLSVQPRNAEALRRLGTISVLERKYSVAEDLFRRALIVRPNDSDTHNDLGYAIQQMGRAEDALREYEAAMDLDPSRIEYKTNYATLLIRLGQATEAEAAVNAALLIDEKDSRALFLKGLLCKADDRIDDAVEALEGAIESDPFLRDAHLNLSELRHYRDGGESFIENYKAAYERDTSDPRGALLYTEALHKCGRYGEIEDVLSPFLEGQFANHPSILNGMAYTLASQGKFDDALSYNKKALQVAHNDPVTHQNYGRTLVQHGDYRSAITQLRQVSAALPLAQDMLALSSLAFGQINDPQAGVLNDRHSLIFGTQFEPEDGDLEAFHTRLKERIESFPVLNVHPFEQAKRLSGTIRQGILSEGEGGTDIQALTTFLGNSIRDFFAATPDNDQHPFLGLKKAGISGVANTYSEVSEFDRKNFPVDKHGLMRGFYFIDVPEECNDDKKHEGWLHFGEPDFVTKDKIEADFEVKPEVGKLVLFPAYMWHGFNALKAKTPMRVLSLHIYGTRS